MNTDQEENLDDFQSEFEPDEPGCEPECPRQDESGMDCEFEVRQGSWWCTTHNCYA